MVLLKYSNAASDVCFIYIYIPIWFYSNEPVYSNSSTNSPIYIPIWFYSNAYSAIIFFFVFSFTFQYGSTQIAPELLNTAAASAFTFQYGSTQMRENQTGKKSADIYIPIWFYSNRDWKKPILCTVYYLHSNMVLLK